MKGGRGEGRGNGGKKPKGVVPFDFRYNFTLCVKTNMPSKLSRLFVPALKSTWFCGIG